MATDLPPVSSAPANPRAGNHDAPPSPPRRWWRILAAIVATALALLVLAVGALWWWAGTDGSLATGLRWVAQSQPLSAEGASGSLRAGGQVKRLVWRQDDLTVDVTDVTLAWQPWSLLHRTLKLNELRAGKVRVDDRRTPSSTPAAPPSALGLPLKVALDEFALGTLEFVGPPAWQATDIAGDYVFTGSEHQLKLASAQFASGRYQGRATLASDTPFRLDAAFSGTLSTPVPGSTTTLPLSFTASAQGPLTDLALQAALQMQASTATATTTSTSTTTRVTGPHATATARITPWAAQPVVEANATFNALDLAALWPAAPQTGLTGQASVRPTTSTSTNTNTNTNTNTSTAAPVAGWLLDADIRNTLPGPWDQRRLPLETLQAQGEWRGGAAVVRSLKAGVGGGQLVASGEWLGTSSVSRTSTASVSVTATPTSVQPSVTSTGTATTVKQDWQLQATLTGVNPGALHTQFAALPVNGRASARSTGDDIHFDIELQTAGAGPAARQTPRRGPTGNAISQLRLRDARATGSWNAQKAGGTLLLPSLQVRTDDATLQGQLEVQTAARGGKGRITLEAPGINAQVNGDIRPASGAGDLTLQARDAQLALRWLQRLPGMPADVLRASAAGRADLQLAWQGGWQDPALQGRLQVPSLDWRMASGGPAGTPTAVATAARPASTALTTSGTSGRTTAPVQAPGASAPAATTTAPAVAATTSTVATGAAPAANPANVLKLRDIDATVSGKLAQSQLGFKGRLESAGRRFALQLAADATRLSSPAGANKLEGLDRSSWQALVKQLDASVEDPALGAGAWRLATRGNTTLRWTPTTAGGALEVGAGEAVLVAPARSTASPATAGMPVQQAGATPSQALIQWQPASWRGGRLTTAGKLTGLPLAWIELFAGPQLAGAGLAGNLVFDGAWDAVLGDTLQVKASLARASGDLTVQAETAQGAATRVAAGVREARLAIDSNGDALSLTLRWDSERAGTADGQLGTRLARNADGGWTWPANAPLNGRLKAQLPRIGVWSVLAPPGWRLRGAVAADIAISGNRAAPQLAGELLANDLALRSVVDGIEFGNGRLRAQLDGTRMRIGEFTLQGAGPNGSGGTLTAQGEAGWIDGQPQVRLDARLTRLRASIRTDRQVTLSGDVQARLDGKLTQLTGALGIDQALILLPEEGTPQLGSDVIVRGTAGAASGQKGPAEANAPKVVVEDGRAVKLDVKIDLGNDFRVQGKGVDTRIRGALALTGDSFANPRLTGSVNTFGGQYRAYGQRLDIEQGLLRFSGPVDNPALDVLAVRPNMTQRVGVQITGTALLPRVRLYAQPELPDAEKLSWLVLGRSAAAGGAEAALLQQAALALLGSKGGGMSGGLASSLGLDELSFRGSASNADGTTTEGAITLGKRFSRNFYAAYERSISGALGTLFIFYDLSQRFTVRAQTGEQSAIDLIYTLPYD
ncbi:MAG: translocation/assembly module TamB domain-containing protein [Polaromonas sp.]|nr:translocation/assembly module TamB domain-containing protein [Polaromonas sp.]